MDSQRLKASAAATLDAAERALLSFYRLQGQHREQHSDIASAISDIEALSNVCSELEKTHESQDLAHGSTNITNGKGSSKCQAALDASHSILRDVSQEVEPLVRRMRGSRLETPNWMSKSSIIRQKLEEMEKHYWILEQAVSAFQADAASSESTTSATRITTTSRPDVMAWYETSDPRQNHLAARKRHQAETGQWVFREPLFETWKSAKGGQVLWLHGIPGAGKTILCSTIIDHMQKHCSETAKDEALTPQIVYFYFDFSDGNKQTVESLLRSCICQLIATRPRPSEETTTLYEAMKGGPGQPSVEELQSVLLAELQLSGTTFLVIDALDECPQVERGQFMELIVVPLRKANVNMLITSRKEVDIEKHLEGVASTISIQNAVVDADIGTYVDMLISEDTFLRSMGSAILKEIHDEIVSRAHGMFRWAACQLETIKTCLTPDMVREKLNCMPQGLDETYNQILRKVPKHHKPFLRSALYWLAFSARPLLLEELAEAIVLRPESGHFDAGSSRLLHPRMILDICGLLVTSATISCKKNRVAWLDKKGECEARGRQNYYDKDEAVVVSLSHYTVKEYILIERSEGDLACYHASEGLGHSYLAQCCLFYLLEFSNGMIASHIDAEVFHENPLLQYAARFWMEHWQNAGREHHQAPLRPLYERFLVQEPRDAYTNWLNIWNPDFAWDNGSCHSYTIKHSPDLHQQPLYWAATLGDAELVKSLLEQGSDMAAREGYFESALGAAAFFGRTDVVAHFLTKGLSPNLPGTTVGTPLQIAIAGGSMNVIRLLIESGADVNAGGGKWSMPLIAASAKQNDQLVKLLLDHGARINQDSQSLGSALDQAAKAGDIRTATFLLNAGADINGSNTGQGTTPLYEAVGSESVSLVQLLLRHGADVNRRGAKGDIFDEGFPLVRAAAKGQLEIIRILLDAGADINVKNPEKDSPLSAAIRGRDMSVVKAMLDAGADLDICDGSYENCFHKAVAYGEMDIARLLMERGASLGQDVIVEAVNIYEKEPWVLENLLEREGVDIDIFVAFSGSTLTTPLHVAVGKYGSDAAANLLLDRHAYVNAISQSDYTTPLCLAIKSGRIAVAERLIELGADVRRTINYSPLELAVHYACSDGGSLRMVDVLLDHGVGINCDTEMALFWPIEAENHAVLRYLVKQGLDVNREMLPSTRPHGGFSFGTFELRHDSCSPVQYAAKQAKLNMLRLLIELGANVNSKPGRRGSTLHYGLLSKDKEIVDLLISHGACIDDSVADRSLLCKAMHNGLAALVPQLVELGADVNATERGESPLATAFQLGDMDLFQSLHKSGARFSEKDTKVGCETIEKGTLEDLRLLLDHGLDPNAKDRIRSILKCAAEKTDIEAMQMLHQYGADLASDLAGAALANACNTGHMKMATFLVDNGAERHINLALSRACSAPNNIAIVEMLLSKGADVKSDNGSCFRTAAYAGCQKLSARLLQEPMTASERSHYLGLALQKAAQAGHLSYCTWLFDNYDAPVNHTGPPWGSPLQAALASTTGEMDSRILLVRTMLQRGANINPPVSFRPKKDIKMAKNPNRIKMGLFCDTSPTYAMPLSLAIVGDRWARRGGLQILVPEFLAQGADPNGEGGCYHTPLQAAAYKDPGILEALLDAGANVNAVGGTYGTALHAAALKNNPEAVNLLLSRGADPRIIAGDYGSVLQAAAVGGRRDDASNIKTLELLLAAGADLHIEAGIYGSVVQAAAMKGNLRTLKWLVSKGADVRAKGGKYGNAYKAALAHLWDNYAVEWHVVSWLEQHYGREGWE